VSGTVTLQGQRLPGGTVLFHGADGRVEHALISAEGEYTIADAPLGKVRITVQSHGAVPAPFPALGRPDRPALPELAPRPEDRRDSKHLPIPERYKDADKSGLTCTVRAGSQTHHIELQP
jgi:hypothetical protein